ncbi:uncharacterized protein BO97DRAFT_178944 [Aspergillus homomorphus CBS 101889]|uniref:Uncharacterized protein n=1 Tax=Aspergillus homomorphus (strain CBS 101889) TaxID=1450537 RepID=A0A395I7B6_ASPHC|nr:hypothetical protein BO97DRAFT_178944 [Aspergillus homomorphus CBS 101889]RAL15997.1 hypothetical protein BO97DRAFT_178944 [Aspergillus homomorphus CBS 101889]
MPQPNRIIPPVHVRRHPGTAGAGVGAPGSGSGVSPNPRKPLSVHDIRQTKEYKTAARKWLSTIVALPVLLYTSYILYERVVGNQRPKRLVGEQGQQQKGEQQGERGEQ